MWVVWLVKCLSSIRDTNYKSESLIIQFSWTQTHQYKFLDYMVFIYSIILTSHFESLKLLSLRIKSVKSVELKLLLEKFIICANEDQ